MVLGVFRIMQQSTPKYIINVFDLGYLGIEKDFLEQLSSLSNRKKGSLKRSQEEIEYNQGQSKKRIVIEHAICRKKIQDHE
jgi:hypothetical protein